MMIAAERQQPKLASGASRRGSTMVFMVSGVALLLAVTVFSVDVASMQLARTELNAATDAAAKAGAEALLRTHDERRAVQAAMDMAELNTVAGQSFTIGSQDVVIGTSVQQGDGSWGFTAGGSRPNAVRVNSRMSAESANGPVTLALSGMVNSRRLMPTRTSTASAAQQEICLCIDRSASMSFDHSSKDSSYPSGGEANIRPRTGSRWDSLKKALNTYLTEVKEISVPSRVALVTWSSDASSESLPTEENPGLPLATTPVPSHVTALLEAGLSYTFSQIESAITRRSEHPLYGQTNMSAGIDKAAETLTSGSVLRHAQRSIVLITDGKWNEGRNPREAAQDARNRGIVIHVVTFLPEAQSVDAQAVATITGGTYLHANSEAELIAAFKKLGRILPVVLTD